MHIVGVPVATNCTRGMKKQLAEKEKKLEKANKQTNKLDNTTKNINQILDNLKPAKFNKNNMVILNEDIEKNFLM